MNNEIMEYVDSRLLQTPPEVCAFKVGDKVTFTNGYGVTFTGKTVIGYSSDILYQQGRFIHLDLDCYWFPNRPVDLKLEQVQS